MIIFYKEIANNQPSPTFLINWSIFVRIRLFLQLSMIATVCQLNIYIFTRLLGRFASIFYFKFCEYFLFDYIVKQKHKKILGLNKISWIFKIFKNRILLEAYFLKFDNPQKSWARLVQSFWRLLDTNRHPSKVYILMKFISQFKIALRYTHTPLSVCTFNHNPKLFLIPKTRLGV